MLITECLDSIVTKLQKNQMDDDDLKDIRNQINNNQAREYLIKNGLLCKEVSGDVLIVVPKLSTTDP